MRGSPALHRPETPTQNFAKISAAFFIGLVTVFVSALLYSNKELSAPAIVPARSVPESSISTKTGLQDTVPATTAVLPKSPVRSGTALSRSAAPARSSVKQPVTIASASTKPGTPQGSPFLPSGPISSVTPQLPPSAFIQQERTTADSSQTHSVSASASVSRVVVPATTALTVQLANTLSSDNNQSGDTFRATLAAPLVVNGYLLADSGSVVQGRVEAVRRASLIGGRSELSVVLTEIGTWDSQRARLQTALREIKGAGMKSAIGSGFMARTKAAILPAGAQMTFILVAPLTAMGTRIH